MKRSVSNNRPTEATLWFDPEKSYKPSRLREPSTQHGDPTSILVAKRTDLLDKTLLGHAELSTKARLELQSISSRIQDSGQLNHDGDRDRVKLTTRDTIEHRQNLLSEKSERSEGNKRWVLGKNAREAERYVSSDYPEPKALVQLKMKQNLEARVVQAQAYGKEFGLAYLEKPSSQEGPEHDLTMKRTHPGAFDRANVIAALRMYRNSFPDHSNAQEARTPSTDAFDAPPSPPDNRRFSTHSNTSSTSFASFVSADTFGASVRRAKGTAGKVTRGARKAVSKIPGFRRWGGKKEFRDELKSIESAVNVASFGESEDEIAAVEARLDKMMEWMTEVKAATDQGQTVYPIELPTTPSQSSEDLLRRRKSKDSAAEVGIALVTAELPGDVPAISSQIVRRSGEERAPSSSIDTLSPEVTATSSPASENIVRRASHVNVIASLEIAAARFDSEETIADLYKTAVASISQLGPADEAKPVARAAHTDVSRELPQIITASNSQRPSTQGPSEILIPEARSEPIESIAELYKNALASVSQVASAEESLEESDTVAELPSSSVEQPGKINIAAAQTSFSSRIKNFSKRASVATSQPSNTASREERVSASAPRPASVAAIEDLYLAAVGPSLIEDDVRRFHRDFQRASRGVGMTPEEARISQIAMRVPGIEDPPAPVEAVVKKKSWGRVKGLLRSGK